MSKRIYHGASMLSLMQSMFFQLSGTRQSLRQLHGARMPFSLATLDPLRFFRRILNLVISEQKQP